MSDDEKPSAGDHRLAVSLILVGVGVAVLVVTALLGGDSLRDALAVATYSIGWTLLTFGALYWLTGWFENMKWNRPDHDLVRTFEDGLASEDGDPDA